jgi:hypothetical protein
MASFNLFYFILFYFTVSFGFLSRTLEKFSILISTSDRYGTSHRRHKKDMSTTFNLHVMRLEIDGHFARHFRPNFSSYRHSKLELGLLNVFMTFNNFYKTLL